MTSISMRWQNKPGAAAELSLKVLCYLWSSVLFSVYTCCMEDWLNWICILNRSIALTYPHWQKKITFVFTSFPTTCPDNSLMDVCGAQIKECIIRYCIMFQEQIALIRECNAIWNAFPDVWSTVAVSSDVCLHICKGSRLFLLRPKITVGVV